MSKKIIIFALLLLGLFIPTFLVHQYFMPDYPTTLFKSYLVNYIMALLVYTILIISSKRFIAQLGFLYMAGSLLKFVLFFLFLNPIYKVLDIDTKVVFLFFFVPYVIAIILETKLLSNILIASDKKP